MPRRHTIPTKHKQTKLTSKIEREKYLKLVWQLHEKTMKKRSQSSSSSSSSTSPTSRAITTTLPWVSISSVPPESHSSVDPQNEKSTLVCDTSSVTSKPIQDKTKQKKEKSDTLIREKSYELTEGLLANEREDEHTPLEDNEVTKISEEIKKEEEGEEEEGEGEDPLLQNTWQNLDSPLAIKCREAAKLLLTQLLDVTFWPKGEEDVLRDLGFLIPQYIYLLSVLDHGMIIVDTSQNSTDQIDPLDDFLEFSCSTFPESLSRIFTSECILGMCEFFKKLREACKELSHYKKLLEIAKMYDLVNVWNDPIFYVWPEKPDFNLSIDMLLERTSK